VLRTLLPIFRNACLNCHNPDKKKAGLDLSTYQATLQGSENGKILRLLQTELSVPEIASELVIAASTVRSHTKSIYSKLNVNNRRAAVKRAAELHLI